MSLYSNGSNVRYRKLESYQRHDGVDITKVHKLGENAKFVIESAQPKGGVFDAALSVVTGAFRFTTQAFAKGTKRDVKIRVGQNATH